MPADSNKKPFSFSPDVDLFLISFLLLFQELALIRWLPAHVLYLTFFTNSVLLASFLGISLGCLSAQRKTNFLRWTPGLLAFTMFVGQVLGVFWKYLQNIVDVGNQNSPQMIYLGTRTYHYDFAHVLIPIELLGGFFFVLTALSFVGVGQQLGQLFDSMPSRVRSYTINISGSMAGIVAFTVCSWLHLPPFYWFLLVVAGLGYFLESRGALAGAWTRRGQYAAMAAMVALAGATSWGYISLTQLKRGQRVVGEHIWSPYYRINYSPAPERAIVTNLIGHQGMLSRESKFPIYSLPYLLLRDAGYKPREDILIIGAGSGNDVSQALYWDAKSVDAVEIDPVIQSLGDRDHPNRPYQDPRVRVHINDGRNFMRSTDKRYDLIIYALTDSLVLHSGYSSLRLENYLFTQQAFEDARKLLKPGGFFVTYNGYPKGWLIGRYTSEMTEAFGRKPVVVPLTFKQKIVPEDPGDYAILFNGDTDALHAAFQKHPVYALRNDVAPGPQSPNGFAQNPKDQGAYSRFCEAEIEVAQNLKLATDDWPFPYLASPMVPGISWRGMGVMGGVSAVLLILFLSGRKYGSAASAWPMFFLGAGFMLIETKAIVHMALLFGSTWMVSTVVFFFVLLLILCANLFILRVRPKNLLPFYIGLIVAIILNATLPLNFFLGLPRVEQILLSSLLTFTPIFFAGVIFACLFDRSTEPEWDFGANVAGAICGGLAENASMVLGFQHLMLVALAFYCLSCLPLLLGKGAQLKS